MLGLDLYKQVPFNALNAVVRNKKDLNDFESEIATLQELYSNNFKNVNFSLYFPGCTNSPDLNSIEILWDVLYQ